jgi:ribosome-associated translation inhibitor RaiA
VTAPIQIQVSSGNAVAVNDSFNGEVSAKLERALGRFADRITRVEVHFNDTNSAKGGPADKHCALEARLKGLEPVVVTHDAPSLELALSGAIDRAVRVLDRTVDRHRHIKGRDPFDTATR